MSNQENPVTYTPHKPPIAEAPEELRKRIPGWGVDLDPKDRPSVPKLQYQEDLTGARWEFPERQPERWPRERSVEHAFLTPVSVTGLSGRRVVNDRRCCSSASMRSAPRSSSQCAARASL